MTCNRARRAIVLNNRQFVGKYSFRLRQSERVSKIEAVSDNVFQTAPKQLIFEQKRFRGKINIQKPRKPHFTRQMVDEYVTPFYVNPNEGKPLSELCKIASTKRVAEKQENLHQKVIERLCYGWFEKSKMVAFLHQNPMRGEIKFEMLVPLHRANMRYKIFGKSILRGALENTPYEAACCLGVSQYALIFSPEPNVPTLTKILRKFPQVILMGGILEGKLLHLEDFLRYGQLDLTSAQAGLVHVLQNAGGNNLSRQLTHHQSTLVTRLKQIGTNETPSEESEKSVPV